MMKRTLHAATRKQRCSDEKNLQQTVRAPPIWLTRGGTVPSARASAVYTAAAVLHDDTPAARLTPPAGAAASPGTPQRGRTRGSQQTINYNKTNARQAGRPYCGPAADPAARRRRRRRGGGCDGDGGGGGGGRARRGALLLVLQLVGEPVEALVEAVAARRARRLDVPVALAQRVQAELVRDLGGVHRVRQVLKRGETVSGRRRKVGRSAAQSGALGGANWGSRRGKLGHSAGQTGAVNRAVGRSAAQTGALGGTNWSARWDVSYRLELDQMATKYRESNHVDPSLVVARFPKGHVSTLEKGICGTAFDGKIGTKECR